MSTPTPLTKKRILVTGASGLLGLNFALQYCDRYDIVGVGNRNVMHGTPFETVQRDFFVSGVADELIEATKPDAVLHCAAIANLEACELNPEKADYLNGEFPGLIAEAAGKRSIPIVTISTDAVFDGVDAGSTGYRETDTPNPINVYARTKLLGEETALSANPGAVVARVNFYGWSISGKRSLSEFFYRNLTAGQTVSGFADVFFCPLYVRDLSRVLEKLLFGSAHGVYHVFGSRMLSKYDFGVEIAKEFGADPELVKPTSWRDGGLIAARAPNLIMNVEKLTAFLGETPPDGVAGLREFRSDLMSGLAGRIQEMK